MRSKPRPIPSPTAVRRRCGIIESHRSLRNGLEGLFTAVDRTLPYDHQRGKGPPPIRWGRDGCEPLVDEDSSDPVAHIGRSPQIEAIGLDPYMVSMRPLTRAYRTNLETRPWRLFVHPRGIGPGREDPFGKLITVSDFDFIANKGRASSPPGNPLAQRPFESCAAHRRDLIERKRP